MEDNVLVWLCLRCVSRLVEFTTLQSIGRPQLYFIHYNVLNQDIATI